MTVKIGTDGPGAIVVGVDGSETSMRAAAFAVGLARRQQAKLVLVYVRTWPPAGMLTPVDSDGTMAKLALETQEETEAQLRQLMRKAKAIGIDASLIARFGDPARQLSELADTLKADEIIVGSSAGIGHRFAGGLGVRLVRSRRWPVTVVP